MQKLQKEITDWHKETFPAATEQQIVDKLLSEMVELTFELSGNGYDLERVIDECDDVFIVMAALLGRKGVNFESSVRYKMARNSRRVWTSNGTVRLSE